MPQQFIRLRRAAGPLLAATLTTVALSGCGPLLLAEKTLPPTQLKSELLTAPTGSKPFSRGTLAPGGILNADQYVDGVFITKDRSAEQTDLAQQGFKYAVETDWVATNGSQADVFLIQFGDSNGAENYVSGVSEATSDEEEPSEPLAALPGLPGAEAWTAGSLDSGGDIRQTAWFAVGNIAVDLHYYTPSTSDAAGLDQLARAQNARLVGHLTAPSPLPAPSGSAPGKGSTGPATATAADRSRLESDLVPLPGNAQPWPANSSNGPTGVLNLTQFLTRFDPSNIQSETAEEQDRGFQYALRENWQGSDGTQANVFLIQFASATGAQSFTLGFQGGAANAVGTDGTYPVPHSGDSMAYQHSGLDNVGNIWTEDYAVVGNIAVDIDFWVPAKADRAQATALFQQQYAKLMADPTVAQAANEAPPLPTAGP